MNQLIRRSALPVMILLVLASCGTSQEVNSSSGSHGVAQAAAAPAANAAAPTTTTTAPPAGVPLWDLPVIGEGISPMHGPIKMNTVVYDNSVYDSLGCISGFTWVFDLNRAYDKLTGTIGLDDTSISQDNVTVTIKGDNNAVLNTTTATLGTVTPISINLAGQLRLRVEVTSGNSLCVPASDYGSTLAIGNALLTKTAK
jgi:hypothetical protein